tara:strand:- start:10 stop:567 length:558 start_codon:yes stop_codon:yes gene_type:complete
MVMKVINKIFLVLIFFFLPSSVFSTEFESFGIKIGKKISNNIIIKSCYENIYDFYGDCYYVNPPVKNKLFTKYEVHITPKSKKVVHLKAYSDLINSKRKCNDNMEFLYESFLKKYSIFEKNKWIGGDGEKQIFRATSDREVIVTFSCMYKPKMINTISYSSKSDELIDIVRDERVTGEGTSDQGL